PEETVKLARWLMGLFLGRRLPRTRGMLHLAGPRQTLTIHRDRWGIPHIEAQNDHDAWFGLGFSQGQDRAFQLELILRISRGTLAELVGVKGVPVDRLARRIGFHRAARAQWAVMSHLAKEITAAFAAGITAGLTHGSSARPHELAILGGWPTPWTALDV